MIELPRVEAEFNWNGKFGEKNNAKIFINGAAQTAKDGVSGTTNSLSSAGFGGGLVLDFSGFALSGSGFWAKGMGSLFMGDAFAGTGVVGIRRRGRRRRRPELVRLHRPAHVFTRRAGKFIIGGSFGENHLKRSDADKTADGADLRNSQAPGHRRPDHL